MMNLRLLTARQPTLILSVIVCFLDCKAVTCADGSCASLPDSSGGNTLLSVRVSKSGRASKHTEDVDAELTSPSLNRQRATDDARPPQTRPAVVVTGAAGFIGSHAVLALLAHGYRVVGVDNFSRGYSQTIETLEDEAKKPRYAHAGGFKFFKVDLGQGTVFTDILRAEKPVAVLHFAGVAYAGESAVKPFKYYMNNTFNTMKVAEAMEEAGVKNLIYSSSCSTYGSPTEMPVTEETPQLPVSAYGRSKLQAEAILKDWEQSVNADGSATPTRIALMRYFNVIGADPEGRVGERRPIWLDSKNSDYKLYVRLSTALFDTAQGLLPKFTIAGDRYDTPDGTAQRDYVHVRDVVDAHVAVLRSMLKSGAKSRKLPNLRFYNVGTGKAYSVREMVDAAKRVTGIDFPVSVGDGRSTDPPAVWADPDKLLREVGWRPQYLNLTETLGHEWRFRQSIGGHKPSMLQEEQEDVSRLANTEIVDESGLSVTKLAPSSSTGVDHGFDGGVTSTDKVATGPGIPDAFEKLLVAKYGGTGADANTELGAAAAVEALEKECGGWDTDASQPKNPACMEMIFKPLKQAKPEVSRSMMVQEMDLVIPTIRNLDFLEDWREFIEGMHVIVVQDGDPDVKLAIPSWVDYELYNRRDINRSLGEKAWAISAKDSSIRIFGFLASKKPYVFTLDDDVFPGRKPNGQRINAPLMHYQNLKTPSTPYYFNTLYDPFAAGADYVRGYPFSLRAGVPTAISHGLWLNTPDYDAPTQLLKPHERNERYAPATMTVPHGTIYSMCGMNMAFDRKLIGPAFMFGLMGEGQPWGRYDDMWAGWASKVCADHMGVGVKTGEPYVNHSKASNPFVNLKKEYRGLFWQEKIVKFFKDVKLSDEASQGPVECYNELSGLVRSELGQIHPYFQRLSEAMQIWTSSWQAAEDGKISFKPSRSSSSSSNSYFAERSESQSRSCNSKVKLIVNSHVKYADKVLPKLWQSLERVHFKRFSDVVVFLGGAEHQSEPTTDTRGVTYVHLSVNAYDYNGFSGLYQYRYEPSVCADAYFYVLDTVEFEKGFPHIFDRLASLKPGTVKMSPRPNSNIVAFGHDVVNRYGTNYDRDLTKQEAVQFEVGSPPDGMQLLESFAENVDMTVDRAEMGMADPYDTGYPRKRFFYPAFDVYKYILWDQYGDIGGGVPQMIYGQ